MITNWDCVWIETSLATMVPEVGYGEILRAALAIKGDRIEWVGKMENVPAGALDTARRVVEAKDQWITPGLIDCHTHIVFGGNRVGEFERRLQGESYDDIALSGGGIWSTVAATREATDEVLRQGAMERLQAQCLEGVTTSEVKSGYGLDAFHELRMLRIAKAAAKDLPITVVPTLLAAHLIPREYDHRRSEYIALICNELIPQVAQLGLAEAVDAFCESIALTPTETSAVFSAARGVGLPVKLHADQLSDQGGAALAASFGALSADHLEYASDDGVRALASAGTVAVLLPGAFLTLRGTKKPPIDRMRQEQVAIAIATDCNPGSSPLVSLPIAMNLACTLFGFSPAEALSAVTRNAARALGLAEDRGTLSPGKRADLAFWRVSHPAEISYWLGYRCCSRTIKDGQIPEDL